MAAETRAAAVAIVEELLARAHRAGASDLHLDPGEDGVEVRMRCDGALSRLDLLPIEMAEKVVGRLKALGELLVYRTDLPQEGRIPKERSGIGAEVRVATYPALLGERVALRLDARTSGPEELSELDLPGAVRAALEAAIHQPEGIVLITGPSGSGKSTTLYACLQHLTRQRRLRSIVTVEDPIERRIRGVTQTEVNRPAGLDFARALRSLLRQDPEVILIGEIRDEETAAIALEAGLTGHLVLSTIHAGSAPLVFARLLEMGVEPFTLTTAVRGVLAQRLVRRRCTAPGCGGSGCEMCNHTGYRGRRPLAEWLAMSAELRRAILDRGDGEALALAARAEGHRGLWREAEDLVAAGLTMEEEIANVLGSR